MVADIPRSVASARGVEAFALVEAAVSLLGLARGEPGVLFKARLGVDGTEAVL